MERSFAQIGIGQAQKSKATPTETIDKSIVKSTKAIYKPGGIPPNVRLSSQNRKIPNVHIGLT